MVNSVRKASSLQWRYGGGMVEGSARQGSAHEQMRVLGSPTCSVRCSECGNNTWRTHEQDAGGRARAHGQELARVA